MKLKQRVGDFRVRELLVDGFLRERGAHRVYRLTKRKLTTPEAVRAVADLAGVDPNEVSIAGLKDRQGITIQHVSVPRGRDLRIQEKELKVDTAGFAAVPVSSDVSRGNAFEIGVRALTRSDTQRLRDNLPRMRDHGVVNYFDDQRFGNLEFGQGWIPIDLMRGEPEKALRALLTGSSERDDERHRRFKTALADAWGDWRACRDIAGKFGAHHSIFEHLGRQSDDFAGAFEHVATRLKTIHLFAYQSHLWNRAVAELVRAETPVDDRVAMPGIEGPLISWAGERPKPLRAFTSFPLPGAGLDDVQDKRAHALFEDVLAKERLVPDQLRVQGISGFHLKGEPRDLVVTPRHLRVRPAENDVLNPGLQMVRVRFELPRGAYATLVVKRLLAHYVGEEAERSARENEARFDPRRGHRSEQRDESQGRRAGSRDAWGRGSREASQSQWGRRERTDARREPGRRGYGSDAQGRPDSQGRPYTQGRPDTNRRPDTHRRPEPYGRPEPAWRADRGKRVDKRPDGGGGDPWGAARARHSRKREDKTD